MKSANDSPRLLDTNVFSYLLKGDDSRGALYLPDIQGRLLAVSFVTVGELYFGAYSRNWGTKRIQELEEKLQQLKFYQEK